MCIHTNVYLYRHRYSNHVVFFLQAWKKNANVRRIVLNKQRQSQVYNLHNKSAKYIKNHCIVLTVQMSSDPSLLKVSAGEGKVFKLALMEGLQPTKEIPKEIDVAAGDTVLVLVYMLFFTLW